jgi:hypothetical protein
MPDHPPCAALQQPPLIVGVAAETTGPAARAGSIHGTRPGRAGAEPSSTVRPAGRSTRSKRKRGAMCRWRYVSSGPQAASGRAGEPAPGASALRRQSDRPGQSQGRRCDGAPPRDRLTEAIVSRPGSPGPRTAVVTKDAPLARLDSAASNAAHNDRPKGTDVDARQSRLSGRSSALAPRPGQCHPPRRSQRRESADAELPGAHPRRCSAKR